MVPFRAPHTKLGSILFLKLGREWYWLIRWASSTKRRSRGGGNDDRGEGDWSRQSCGGLRGSRRIPAVTRTARKAVGAAMACLYTGTTPTLAKLIATTAETQGFLHHFPAPSR